MAESFLNNGAELVIIKYGSEGSIAWTKNGDRIRGGIYPADLKKTFGAGDAFAAGLLRGLTGGLGLKKSMADGAAAASIVISRYSCSEASPTIEELEAFMQSHEMQIME